MLTVSDEVLSELRVYVELLIGDFERNVLPVKLGMPNRAFTFCLSQDNFSTNSFWIKTSQRVHANLN